MFTLKVTPQGAELIIGALRQLPHNQVHDLVMELFGQIQAQQQAPAVAKPAEPAPEIEHVAEDTGSTD